MMEIVENYQTEPSNKRNFDDEDEVAPSSKKQKSDESELSSTSQQEGQPEDVTEGATSATCAAAPSSSNDINSQIQGEVDDHISFEIFTNDGKNSSSMALVTLKNIFSKQLPKMPKEYIVRLVFDHRHYSLAIKRGNRIIGGICYRPYYDQRFGEIAFCAISGTEQVKGYGTMMMNQLKHHVQKEKLEYFLTYADNYAIGYFQKQGFSKSVAMPKERWVGYIKDYDGGTLMECYIHPGMDYLNVPKIVAMQRAFIYERIKERTQSTTIYPGLDLFRQGKKLTSILDVPGVTAAGWTAQQIYRNTTERDRNMNHSKLCSQLKGILEKIKGSPHAWPFHLPIGEAQGNQDLVKDPINLTMISERLRQGDYYRNKEMMLSDLLLMVENCKIAFKKETDVQYEEAENMERLVLDLFRDGSTGAATGAGGAGGGEGGSSSSTRD